jgi:hypothetical protein
LPLVKEHARGPALDGLSAVDRLRQGAVEEGVLHVELVDRPVPGQS